MLRPLQWRGRAGVTPASEHLRSQSEQLSDGQILGRSPTARKMGFQFTFEPGPLRNVGRPLFG